MTAAVVTIPTELPEVVFREARDSDTAFLISSWLRSFAASKLALMADSDAYFQGYKLLVEAALSRSRVLVACQKADPDAIVGWVAVEPGDVPRLHYVYVKHPFRRFGVARRLLSPLLEKPCVYTHETPVLRRLTVPSQWTYNPFLFFAGAVT